MRRGVTVYTLKSGEECTIGDISKLCGVSVGGLYYRMNSLGLSLEEAMSKPLDENKRGKKDNKSLLIDNKALEPTENQDRVYSKPFKDRLVEIMSKPINPKKDAYLELSIIAKGKNWNLRKGIL